MVIVFPLNRARAMSLSLHPSTEGLSTPLGTHEQDLEISLSTCTEPWMNVRRSIALREPPSSPGPRTTYRRWITTGHVAGGLS